MEKCNQPCEKRIKGVLDHYVTEECGCKAKTTITYILNNKEVIKHLCGRHFKSVTGWLNKIKVQFKEENH